MNLRIILRSLWMQALLGSAALLGYHYWIATIRPATGELDPSTFPLYATLSPVLTAWVIAPVVTFAAWLTTLCWCWRRESRTVPITVAVAFVVALNVTTAMTRGGMPALWRPFTRIQPESKTEYFADVNRVDPGPLAFVRNYTKIVPTLSLHSSTHPPGPVLYLWVTSRVFGNGIIAAALSAIIGTALSIYPFSLLARTVLGPMASRHAIELYSVTPSLVLFGATCMDGLYLFFPLLAAYFFHRSWKENPIRYSILTGLALSASMFFTFMTVCIGLIFAIEAILSIRYPALWRQVWRNLTFAAGTFVVVHWLLRLTTGYSVIRGFATARRAASAYRTEMYSDFWHYLNVSGANLTAFLIGIGIITAAMSCREIAEAWSAWRARRETDLLWMSLCVALPVLAFATIFCAETERVWMFLMPLAILAAARHLSRHEKAHPRSQTWCAVLILLFAQTLTTELLLDTFW